MDESTLTGESLPVSKQCREISLEAPLAEQSNRVFKGTLVASGQGKAVVVGTGQCTEIWQNSTAGRPNHPRRYSSATTACRGKRSAGAAVQRGMCGDLRGGCPEGIWPAPRVEKFHFPGGGGGTGRVARCGYHYSGPGHSNHAAAQNFLIRALNAVEALGSVQVICLDKTGTITQNHMVVQIVYLATGPVVCEEGTLPDEHQDLANTQVPLALQKLLEVGVLCSESEIVHSDDGSVEVRGSPTENALIHLAMGSKLEVQQVRQQHPSIATHLRTDNRNIMSTLHQGPDGSRAVAAKGSPEEILQRCTHWMKDSTVHPPD